MNTLKMKYREARKIINDGDILLFRGQGIVADFIKVAGQSDYSHVGVASWHGTNGGRMLECVEFREWKGGRTVNLEQYVKDNSGVIDVYRPDPYFTKIIFNPKTKEIEIKELDFNGKNVTNSMRKTTGLPYGWSRIWWMAKRKIPFLRFIYDVNSIMDDDITTETYPVCSTAVARAFSIHGYDLVKNRSDDYTEPSDIARSSKINYLFTLEF